MPEDDLAQRLVACVFPSKEAEQRAKKTFLEKNSEKGLPEEVIEEASRAPNWTMLCEPGRPSDIVSGIHWVQNDWFLCTLKQGAVREGMRGHGIGTRTYRMNAEDALRTEGCRVLAADVTFDNRASIRALENAGFQKVNRFCWEEGEKPARILQFVRMHPTRGNKCPAPGP